MMKAMDSKNKLLIKTQTFEYAKALAVLDGTH